MVFNCLDCQAPPYLVELCQPVAGVTSRQSLSFYWGGDFRTLYFLNERMGKLCRAVYMTRVGRCTSSQSRLG